MVPSSQWCSSQAQGPRLSCACATGIVGSTNCGSSGAKELLLSARFLATNNVGGRHPHIRILMHSRYSYAAVKISSTLLKCLSCLEYSFEASLINDQLTPLILHFLGSDLSACFLRRSYFTNKCRNVIYPPIFGAFDKNCAVLGCRFTWVILNNCRHNFFVRFIIDCMCQAVVLVGRTANHTYGTTYLSYKD